MTEQPRCVSVFLLQLLALHIKGSFRLLPVVPVLAHFQPFVIGVEYWDVHRQSKVRVAEPVVGFARRMKIMVKLFLIAYCSQLSAQRDGRDISGTYRLDLPVRQFLLGRQQPQFRQGTADARRMKQDHLRRHGTDLQRRLGRKVEQETEQIQLLFVKRNALVVLRRKAFQTDLHTSQIYLQHNSALIQFFSNGAKLLHPADIFVQQILLFQGSLRQIINIANLVRSGLPRLSRTTRY